MDPTETLIALHIHEEEIRAKSLAEIYHRPALRDHWTIVSEAMKIINAFASEHQHQGDDELTLQFLGIRLFNAAAASIKLALSGYYQKAFDQVRDVLETGFLVDYLVTYPHKIAEWKAADKKARQKHFGAGIIRNALDKRDGYTSGARKAIYDLISEAASHASYRGFALMANSENHGEVGPFFDEKKLGSWLVELAKRFPHAALHVNSGPGGTDLKLLAAREHYLDAVNAWRGKYLVSRN
ncbi:MAG: hypothetical protein WBX05_21655 [Pseudolabrys sp.]